MDTRKEIDSLDKEIDVLIYPETEFLSGRIEWVAFGEINCSTGKLLQISWNYGDLTLFLKAAHLKDVEKANLI